MHEQTTARSTLWRNKSNSSLNNFEGVDELPLKGQQVLHSGVVVVVVCLEVDQHFRKWREMIANGGILESGGKGPRFVLSDGETKTLSKLKQFVCSRSSFWRD